MFKMLNKNAYFQYVLVLITIFLIGVIGTNIEHSRGSRDYYFTGSSIIFGGIFLYYLLNSLSSLKQKETRKEVFLPLLIMFLVILGFRKNIPDMIIQDELHGAVIKGDPRKDLPEVHLADGQTAYLLYPASDWVIAIDDQERLVQINSNQVKDIYTLKSK